MKRNGPVALGSGGRGRDASASQPAARTTVRAPRLPVGLLVACCAGVPRAGAVEPGSVTGARTPAETGRAVASKEPGWPQFRGPRRDGVSEETGLLRSWPEGGPRLIWSVSGLGRGYSSPVVVSGRGASGAEAGGVLYVTGDVGDDLVISAFDLDGKLRWRRTNGRAWKGPWPGARASCTYQGGRLYHMNAHGRAVCLDVARGPLRGRAVAAR